MDELISRQAAIDAICKHGTELERRGVTVLSIANHKQATIDLLESLPSAQPDLDEWCTDCKEYDHEKHCCPRWNRVIRNTVEEIKDTQPEPRWIPVDGKERLPKEGQRVLVTDEDGEIDIAHIIDYSDIGEGIEWWSHDYQCHPIAWSELPTAYERSGDETETD